jgi:hypothetical protein
MNGVGMEVTPSLSTDLGVTRTDPWTGLAKCSGLQVAHA